MVIYKGSEAFCIKGYLFDISCHIASESSLNFGCCLSVFLLKFDEKNALKAA